MSTEQDTTQENTEELIPVETPPQEGQTPADDADDDDDDGDDGEDARLGTNEDDNEDDIAEQRRSKRKRRRDMQRRGREAAERQIEFLRQQNEEMMRRLAAVEGHAINSNAQTLEERIAKNMREIAQAEHFIAKATEAGNGDDVVAAMRIRDQAIAEARQLEEQKARLEQTRSQPAVPQVDPAVVNYAKEWMTANPWYDPQARDEDSRITKQIDAQLVIEGFNPATRVYWEELTARVAEALGEDDDTTPQQRASAPRKKGPPVGTTREHAPKSTKNEIYVTPERKQAMIDAGVWDDPVQRQRYLKAYQAYDNSAR